MNVESMYREAVRRADERFDEILVRLLTADLPDILHDPSNPCRKCTTLLHEYVRCKLALHRYNRWHAEYGCWGAGLEGAGGTMTLRARVGQARSAFHASSCECGEFLWKGRRWHEQQRLLRLKAAICL